MVSGSKFGRNLAQILRSNERRLTTPYDVYMTLRHLVAGFGNASLQSVSDEPCVCPDRDFKISKAGDIYRCEAGNVPVLVESWGDCIIWGPECTHPTQQLSSSCLELLKGKSHYGSKQKALFRHQNQIEFGVFDFIAATPHHHPQSLLLPVPVSRTCDAAGLLKSHCQHAGTWVGWGTPAKIPAVEFDAAVVLATQAVEDVIDRINYFNEIYPSCEALHLGSIEKLAMRLPQLSARSRIAGAAPWSSWWQEETPLNNAVAYRVQFSTVEGKLLFDATLGISDSGEYSIFTMHQVTRYAPKKACIPAGALAEYCFCDPKFCLVEPGVDYRGSNLSIKEDVANAHTCAALCADNTGCRSFTYNTAASKCYFKGQVQHSRTAHQLGISGLPCKTLYKYKGCFKDLSQDAFEFILDSDGFVYSLTWQDCEKVARIRHATWFAMAEPEGDGNYETAACGFQISTKKSTDLDHSPSSVRSLPVMHSGLCGVQGVDSAGRVLGGLRVAAIYAVDGSAVRDA